MTSPDSKKFYFTLTVEEAAELEQAAAYQQLAAAQVIRNRLREWQQATQSRPSNRSSSLPEPEASKLLETISQLDSHLTGLHQTLQSFDPNRLGSQTGQQLRASLQPLYQRLQQMEASLAELGKSLLHQDSAADTQPEQSVRFQRVEVFLEAIHLLTERLLLGLTPEQSRSTEQAFLDEVYARLLPYLNHDGRLDR